MDKTGADKTTELANVIKYVPEANNWHFTIDNSNGELKANDVYVIVLAGLYVDMSTGSQSPIFNTQIPLILMEKLKLLDTSAYGVMVDQYLAMADPYIQKHFFDGSAIFFIVFFMFFPGMMTAGNAAMFILIPAAYWGMAIFNVPISVLLVSYWAGLGIGIGNLLTMIEGQNP